MMDNPNQSPALMFHPADTGISLDANRVNERLRAVEERFNNTVTLGGAKGQAFAKLWALKERCGVENWDGEGASAMDSSSYIHAGWFLESLPASVPAPHVTVDPDGEVDFEWGDEARRVFSVSVSPTGKLSFAGLYGYESVRGSAFFRGEPPEIVLQNLARVFPLGHGGR